MAAEYEVNIKINSQQVTRQLGDIDQAISRISKTASNVGKPKGGSSRRKPGIAGLLPSSEELKAAERGLVQLTVKTKNLQNIAAKAKDLQSVQAKFSERRLRSLNRSNTLNEKELRLSQRLTSEARTRLRLLSQSGAKGFDAPRPQGRQMAESINALTNVQDKRARLLNKINEMEAKGLNVQKLRKQLGKATTEQAARRFGSAEKEFRILEKTLRLEQSKLRILKEQQKGFAASPVRGTPTMMGSPAQIAAAARAGGATSPIRGGLDFPGSPAFLAGATASRTPFGPSFPTGGAALPVRGSTAIPGSPKAIQAAKATNLRAVEVEASWSKTLKGLQDNAKVLELQGVNTQTSWNKALGGLQDNAKVLKLSGVNTQTSWGKALTGLQDNAKVLKLSGVNTQTSWGKALSGLQDNAKVLKLSGVNTQTSWGKALGELQETAGILKLKDARIKQSWNIALQELQETAGMLKMKDARIKQSWAKALSELEETAKDISENRGIQGRKRRRSRLEQVGLGAGFPLLFGGGAGSVIGGGLGGLTGSFGAQIAFSAIGQQIDQFVAGMVDAGKALTSVGGAADFMAEKSLFSSDAMQFRIEKLIEEGNVTEAAALMTQEMAKQVGGSGLKALKDLGTEASKMGKLFGTVMLRIQAFMAQALTPLIKLINSAIGGMVAQNQLDQMLAEAKSPEQRAAILARSNELRGTRKQGRASVGRNAFTMEMLQTLQSEFPAAIPEGAAIEPTGLEVLRAADSGADKAAKDKERMSDIARRAQERLQIMQQEGDLAKELKKLDFERAAEIEKINKLENVGLEERQNAVQATNNLYDALKGEVIGETLAKDLQTAIDLRKAQEDVLRPLEDQRRLLQGKLDGNEKEVRLKLEIENIMRSVKGLSEEDVENAVRKNALLQEQIAVVEKLDQVYASIGQSITSGIVDSLTAAVEGTKSLADVASQTLRQVANILMQFGVQTALSSLGGNDGVGFFSKLFPQRALGGSVSANQPYMVGERGPELFVPGAQGNIVPNNAMGGANVVVNVDASGSNVQGNGQQGKALGQAIGAAVQAELIKQKRPGGLLS